MELENFSYEAICQRGCLSAVALSNVEGVKVEKGEGGEIPCT